MTLGEFYPLLKGLHVVAAMLFVGGVIATTVFLSSLEAHGDLTTGQRAAVVIARRWDRGVTTPAMLTVWAIGLGLALSGSWFHSGWLPLKLVFVLVLSGVHGMQSGALRRLAGGEGASRPQTAAFIIIFVCILFIAVLAVVKPF